MRNLLCIRTIFSTKKMNNIEASIMRSNIYNLCFKALFDVKIKLFLKISDPSLARRSTILQEFYFTRLKLN